MEDDTAIGRVWEASNTFLTTVQRDFFPWPRCSHEQDPKIEFALTSTNLQFQNHQKL